MAEKRLYVVTEETGEVPREHLVNAISKAAALSHVVMPRHRVEIASASDVARVMQGGGVVQESSNEGGESNIQHPAPEANKMRVPKS